MNIAIISAIIGGIDEKKEIPEQYFADDLIEMYFDYVWSGTDNLDQRRQALWYKTQMHHLPLHTAPDLFIWIDGKIQITSPDFVKSCVDQLGDSDFAILKHHERNCIYQEFDHILHCIKKGNQYLATRYAHRPLLVEKQNWARNGYPANNGLNDCKIFIVRNNEKMNKLFDMWWHFIKEYNFFDQTTIQALCWNNNIKIKSLVFPAGYFEDVPHKILK